MARRRGEAGQVLVLDRARRHPDRAAGVSRQAALPRIAVRGRLSRAQAGARPRPLRGARLARLPSPRRAMHRGLRLPGRRAGGDRQGGLAEPAASLREALVDPLRTRRRRAGRSASPSRRYPTPRRRRFAPSAMSRTRSRRCAGAAPEPWPERCQDVHAAHKQSRHDTANQQVYDAAGLGVLGSGRDQAGVLLEPQLQDHQIPGDAAERGVAARAGQ